MNVDTIIPYKTPQCQTLFNERLQFIRGHHDSIEEYAVFWNGINIYRTLCDNNGHT